MVIDISEFLLKLTCKIFQSFSSVHQLDNIVVFSLESLKITLLWGFQNGGQNSILQGLFQ